MRRRRNQGERKTAHELRIALFRFVRRYIVRKRIDTRVMQLDLDLAAGRRESHSTSEWQMGHGDVEADRAALAQLLERDAAHRFGCSAQRVAHQLLVGGLQLRKFEMHGRGETTE